MTTKRHLTGTTYRGHKIDALRVAFDAVSDPTNWKNPVAGEIDKFDFEKTAAAVAFFTGSVLVVKGKGSKPGTVRVAASGYYASIGA